MCAASGTGTGSRTEGRDVAKFAPAPSEGAAARIVTSKMNVSEAYRQVPMDPAGAHVFCYTVDDTVVSDLRLQFG